MKMISYGLFLGLLYAVGGYDGATRQCLSTVEAYNTNTNEWSYRAEMGTRRSGAGNSQTRSHAYLHKCCQSTCICVNQECLCWTGVGVLKGLLYAVGGHDGPLVRKSCEVYDPATNTWKQVADMNMCRRNAGELVKYYILAEQHNMHHCAS